MTIGITYLPAARRGEMPPRHFLEPPFRSALPSPLYFRVAHTPADAAYPRHSHSWGEFVYSYSGVMEISLADRHYLAPPQYGIWLPPDIEHQGLNRHEAYHCSLYVSRALCDRLPDTTCALTLSPLLRAMLEHLRQKETVADPSAEHQRFLQVVVDLLTEAPRVGSYLPWSTDAHLAPVLAHLQDNPGDNRSLAEFARLAGTTERTLIRRCQGELGMTFSEWKQRLRVLKAMPLLEGGETVDAISARLGYGNASAFIAMFKRMTGTTPDEYRRSAA